MLKLTLNNCVIFGRAQNFPRAVEALRVKLHIKFITLKNSVFYFIIRNIFRNDEYFFFFK